MIFDDFDQTGPLICAHLGPAQIKLFKPVRFFDEPDSICKRLLRLRRVYKREWANLGAYINHYVHEYLNLATDQTTIDKFELLKIIWPLAMKDRPQVEHHLVI